MRGGENMHTDVSLPERGEGSRREMECVCQVRVYRLRISSAAASTSEGR